MRTLLSNSVVWFHACISAFQLLTTLYVPIKITYNDATNRRSVVFYPLVGLFIGGVLFIAAFGFFHVLPSIPAGVCLLIVWVVLTGGLHLDGLLDTADGILSRQPRVKMLEIMKDSRIGAMGAIVCVLYLLLKVSLIIPLLSESDPVPLTMLILIPMWSRIGMVWAIVLWPYARAKQGMGSYLAQVGIRHALLASFLAISLTTVIIYILGLYHYYVGMSAVLMIVGLLSVTCLAGWIISVYLNRKLGGLTGDTYGALNELLELVLLFTAVCLLGMY